MRLQLGDILQLYINDEFFEQPREENAFLSVFKPHLDIVYEDENLMLLNKRPGLLCHADEHEKVNTLITHIQAYLYQKKEWNPRDEHSFTPALCNRIDRTPMAENGTDVILDEISGDEIQSVLDTLMGNSSISFMDYVASIIQGKVPFDPADMGRQLIQSVFGNIGQQKSMLLYVLLLAVIGAVITNFSKLMQGKQVATTAFYGVYLLLFSVLTGAFMQASTLAVQTLSGLLEFIKVLTPAYFISMSFASGAGAGAVYYEFALVIVAVIDLVLVKILLPAINVFFLLQLANELSEEEMFGKMAELVKDLVTLALKTMFGIMMGINVIQGLIVPVSAELQNSTLIKAGGAIPGVGNTISTVTNTVLVAAKLVKNAVGVAGVIAVFLLCAVPLLKLLFWQFGYQLVAAVVQPVSEPRVIRCLGAIKESLALLVRAVAFGAMLFIASILVISSMT